MTRLRTLGILALVTVAAVIAVVSVGGPSSNSSGQSEGNLLLPALAPVVNDVHTLVVTHAGQRFSAHYADGAWMMPERGGFAVSESAVRNLIVAIANTRKIQPMTAKPERYEKLGLEAPDSAESYAVSYELIDDAGKALTTLIVGHRNPSKVNDSDNEIYVRTGSDPQSWLVESKVAHYTEPADLLAVEVSDIDLARVASVTVTHADGERVRVSRAQPGESSFELLDVPDGSKVLYGWAVDDIGRVFSELRLEDVRPENELEFASGVLRIELETFDGLHLGMESIVTQDGQYARLSAATGPAVENVVHEALRDAEQVEAEALALSDTWTGWAYQFSDYRYGTFTKRMAELITPIGEQETQ